MKSLQSVHTAAVTIDNLMSAYDSTAVSYVSGHEVDEEKYPLPRYKHVHKKAAAQKAVYDATKECQVAAQALDDANERLIAALREVRRLNP